MPKNTDSTTPCIRLRAVEPDDVDCLYIWENDRNIWPFGANRAPMSRHQLWEYANNYDANPFSSHQLRLIIETVDNTPVPCGTIDLYDIDPVNARAMVGVMVIPEWRNKGIATQALLQTEKYCRDTLCMKTLASEVASDNRYSAMLFARHSDFTLVGERPDWYRRGDTFVSALLFQKKLS